MLREYIGKQSIKIKNYVERGAVKKFAEAIKDLHPLYLDEAYGKQSRYRENIAPPTFPITFDYGTIADLRLPDKGLIHGEQTFRYERPLLMNEEVYCWMEVNNYVEKRGDNEKLGFLFLTKHGENASGKLLFSAKQIIILNEAVRREMLA
ncbi:dehydratase [Bacillus sp. FJAT-27231]|uniref:MaoC family dehydratase N-terminal domain-containing protein n=1 Tax=Bacillus sp. FJAT-27231 TaxID=1679168 RepID=UPI000670D354|nr:MaoC family dehydratase N-terminal domain-containing protein [Bacillus sp. FJAT-27231]KMY53390.1 dehydratase [Bacillus sp. FJAT-27231]